MEMPNLTEAQAELRRSVRDLASANLRSGKGNADCTIELEDSVGNTLEVLPIRSLLH